MAEETFSGFFAPRFGALLRKARFRRCAQNDRGREKRLDEAAKLQMQKVTGSQDDRSIHISKILKCFCSPIFDISYKLLIAIGCLLFSKSVFFFSWSGHEFAAGVLRRFAAVEDGVNF